MKVTRVEIVIPWKRPENLLAYCTIELDRCFVVHGVRLINGPAGWFVAMPSKKAGDRCQGCGAQNDFDEKFCSQCGKERLNRPMMVSEPRAKKHQDIAHPITQEFRRELHEAVFAAYRQMIGSECCPTGLGAQEMRLGCVAG